VLLVELFDFLDGSEEVGSLFGLVLADRGRGAVEKAELVLFVVLALGSALGTSEEVLEFLFWEVHIVVTMRVRVFCGVVAVILPERV